MKMMKTDMEFVTFDAQDVITTSGPIPTPTGLSFKLTGGLFDLQDSGWQYDGEAFWLSDLGGEFNISGADVELTDENYYTIAEGASYSYSFTENPDGSYGGSLYFYSGGLTAGNNGAEEKNSLKEILGWLGVNKIIQ